MSAFNPMALSAGPYQKQALIQRLMQQYQQQAARSAGLAGGGAAGPAAPATGGVPFGRAHQFGGTGLTTAPMPSFGPGLLGHLGPGAMGIPAAGETGQGAAMTVPHPVYTDPNRGSLLGAMPVPGLSMMGQLPSVPGARATFSPGAPTGFMSRIPVQFR